ncbi:hypothetical protein N9R81_02785 [Flavobacteriales bacterium]|nr:hypothetical protein [Flavobacteriales bacterium]
MLYDITILTDHRYVSPTNVDWYIQNVLDEDQLVKTALEKEGMRVYRTNWDNPDFDWSSTKYILFRTTWDYFDRFDEFDAWLNKVSQKTKLINPEKLIRWSLDKHYLQDLEKLNIPIPSTYFVEPGDKRSLTEIFESCGWAEAIVKPAISGAARHTYRLTKGNVSQHDSIFAELIQNESMLLQEFQNNVLTKGEVSFMVFGGKYSHTVLKKAKPGDFRVQDDFGGSLHEYTPTASEIEFAENAAKACQPLPLYARVDAIWDNNNQLCVSELELIEPELWFRKDQNAADRLASEIISSIATKLV